LDNVVAIVASEHFAANMALDNVVTFDNIVEFVSLLVAQLMSFSLCGTKNVLGILVCSNEYKLFDTVSSYSNVFMQLVAKF
jgi:uncharacterized protein YbgA (DUF1722 family)